MMDADQQLRNVISDGGLLTAKSGILKSGWSEVTVKMLSHPEKARRFLEKQRNIFVGNSENFRDAISY